jgi:hypothetical protein
MPNIAITTEDGSYSNIIEDVTPDKLRDTIIALLKKGEVFVTFTKQNGETRVLRGTLKPSLLPEVEHKAKREIIENKDVIRCFDLDKEEFRSFRVDSVTVFQVK